MSQKRSVMFKYKVANDLEAKTHYNYATNINADAQNTTWFYK